MANGLGKIADLDSMVRSAPEKAAQAARQSGNPVPAEKAIREEMSLIGKSGSSPAEKAEKAEKKESPPEIEVRSVVSQLNELVQSLNRKLRFSVHEGSGRMKVTVMSSDSEKVIREIPPEEFLDMISKIDEAIGMIFDEKV